MNAETKGFETSFLEPTTAELPALSVPTRAFLDRSFERIKDGLLNKLLEETPEAEVRERLLRVANEAVALACMTPFPLLVLPLLLEEEIQTERQKEQRQTEFCR